MEHIRNIRIIAHVDHGKTRLVEQLLKQSVVVVLAEETRFAEQSAMDGSWPTADWS